MLCNIIGQIVNYENGACAHPKLELADQNFGIIVRMNFVIFPEVGRHHRERKKGLLIGPLSIDTRLFLSLTHFFPVKTARFLLESVLSSLFLEVRRKYGVLLLFYSDSFLYCIRLQLQIPNSHYHILLS